MNRPDDERITVRDFLSDQESPFALAEDARRGLSSRPRTMPPKYLYDARGSALFEEITRLPEYYQTRTELAILKRVAPFIVDRVRPDVLVEFGSGSAYKTRALLDEMKRAGRLDAYVMLDVSRAALEAAAVALTCDYPRLHVDCLVSDFEHVPELPYRDRRRLFAFLGSTIGNFEADEAEAFLRRVSERMQAEDAFLIGFDLVKDVAVLEQAYNDDAGVTAAFNLNLLRVLNREIGADFEPAAFEHRAVYDEAAARIEMHLVSRADQSVYVDDLDLRLEFRAGETIRTELSHKYTRRSVEGLLETGGLVLEAWETDTDGLFALGLARRR